jgi:hypothetical protein
MLSRRSLLLGAAAVAAPAIIRPGILMPVKRILVPDDGVALMSIAHPMAGLREVVAPNISEEAFVEFWYEVTSGDLSSSRGLRIL